MTTIGGNGSITITLTFHQQRMLKFIAERGGRVEYKYGTKPLGPQHQSLPVEEIERLQTIAIGADDSVRKMAPIGVIRETAIVGRPDTVWLELTDMGRNVIEAMKIKVQ